MNRILVAPCLALFLGVMLCIPAWLAIAPSKEADAATPEHALDVPYVKYMDPARRDALLNEMTSAGADSVKVEIPWDHLEYAGDDKYEWGWLDAFVNAAESRGLKIHAQVSAAPPWVSPCSVWEPPMGSSDLTAYRDFLFDIVSRYGTRIEDYEIWNEPNIPDFWQCHAVSPADYAAMLRAGYLGAKAANPNVNIVGGSLSENDIGYLERMYTALRAYPDAAANDDFFDALGVHPYAVRGGIALAPNTDPAQANYTTTFGQKNSAFLGIDYMRATLDSHGDQHKNIWLGEFGYSTENSFMQAVPDDVRAGYLKEAYSLIDQRPWVIGLCWYKYYEVDRGFQIYNPSTGVKSLTFRAFGDVSTGATPPPPSTVTTVDLPAKADTQISQASPTSNSGSNTSMRADGDDPETSGKDEEMLLRFDTSAIPAGKTIESASLVFTVDPADASNSAFQVNQLKRSWVESQANWLRKRAGIIWEVEGAYGARDRDSTNLGNIVVRDSGRQAYPLNTSGVAAVQGWVNGTSANYGLIIFNRTNTDGFTVNSRESATGNPVLRVTYH
jgi:hypothetical protein